MTYIREIDKNTIPTCNIMGVDIAAINMDWLIKFTDEHLKELSGDYICVSNVHTTVTASEDESYKSIQNGGIMAIPDGGPLSSLGRKHGYLEMQRTTGPEYMVEILKISADKGYRHFFYGSTDETLDKMKTAIERLFPGTEVAGTYSPPFRELSQEEDIRIIDMINAAEPDFVWVGLGAPKQEKWMAAHQGKVRGLMVGVGAAFDYLAGNIKRAPEWMQKMNLEWAYRLMQDPKRLMSRYLNTNAKFLVYAMKDKSHTDADMER